MAKPPNSLMRLSSPQSGGVQRQDGWGSDPMNSPFLAAEFAKMGKMRPVKTASTSADLITIPFCCSDNGEPFVVTMGKDRANEPYHIKSLDRTYTRFLAESGYRLTEAKSRRFTHDECDWTGFQCFHCGAGKCVGNAVDWVYCSLHEYAFCGNRVEAIHGGGLKTRCPGCATWAMSTTSNSIALQGVDYSANKGGRW